MPLMIHLLDLCLRAWLTSTLSKIVSLVGIPLYANQQISQKKKISYARVLIEVYLRTYLPYEVSINLPNGRSYIYNLFGKNMCRTVAIDVKAQGLKLWNAKGQAAVGYGRIRLLLINKDDSSNERVYFVEDVIVQIIMEGNSPS